MNCEEMTDWDTYQVWGSTIPIGVLFGSLAPVIAYTLVILYCDAFRHRNKTCMHCVFKAAKFLLGDQLNMSAKRPDRMNTVEAIFIMTVFLQLWIITSCGIVTFWNVALIEENLSASCVPGFDCFPFNGTIFSGRNLMQHEAISEANCSLYESDERVSIICIRFVWKFTEGFGVAGGLVTLSVLLCKLHMAVISGMVSCCFDSCGTSECGVLCIMIPTLAFDMVIGAVLTLVLFGVPAINEVILTDQTLLLYWMYCVSAVLSLQVVGISSTYHLYLQKLISNSTQLAVSRNQDPERI